MGRAFEVRKAAMAKTSLAKAKVYSRYGKEVYVAAKAGVPDPEMNPTLKRVIEKAKANQVPADVIKRAIDKAKGGSGEQYSEIIYEGFGTGAATILVECLTDNTNRSIADVRSCFNKSHAKLGVSGAVSHAYEKSGLLSFNSDDEEGILDALIMANCDVKDIETDEGNLILYIEPTDLYKAKDVIDSLIENCDFSVLEITYLPNEYVELVDQDKELFVRLLNLLDEVDDVQNVYHNVRL